MDKTKLLDEDVALLARGLLAAVEARGGRGGSDGRMEHDVWTDQYHGQAEVVTPTYTLNRGIDGVELHVFRPRPQG
jgi:hypothetical protein